MQAQNTNPKPTAAEVVDAWAAYEAARNAAVAGGWTYDLSMAAADAYAAYDWLNVWVGLRRDGKRQRN